MQRIEPLAHTGHHAHAEALHRRIVAQHGGDRALFRLRCPCAHVAEQAAHRAGHVHWGDDPAHAHTRRRERLGNAVHVDRVWRDLRADTDRMHVRRLAERERPVDLVVHQVERTVVRAAPRVFLNDELADVAQRVGGEGRAGWIQGRAEREQPGATHRLRERLARRQELRRRIARHLDALGVEEVHVVVVVPRRRGVHHRIAGVEEGAVRRIDAGSGARGDDHRGEIRAEAELATVQRADRFTQCERAVGGRVVGLAAPQRIHDPVLQHLGDAELGRAEVADGEIADVASARDEGADVGGDLENFGAHQGTGDGRNALAARLRAGTEGGCVVCRGGHVLQYTKCGADSLVSDDPCRVP